MTKVLNITAQDMKNVESYMDLLSDVDEMTDGSVGIEWDGMYGRYWESFDTQEEATARLDSYKKELNKTVLEVREFIKQDAIAKGRKVAAKRRALREAKTLGGQFPILQELLEQSR